MIQQFDVIVLGAGAAGLMCAIEAGKRGRRVAVLERSERVGKKILISGGGRCNFTNLYCQPQNFLSANPHFCKSALARYTPRDFISLVENYRIPYHEKVRGQLFCDGSAREIVSMLEHGCAQSGVKLFLNTAVREVGKEGRFIVVGESAEFQAPALVIATGGLSIPKIGATSFGYDLAAKFNIRVQGCRPGLVPLRFNSEDHKNYSDLAGVSAEVITGFEGVEFRDKLLITHRGLSGPAILQVSSYWRNGEEIVINLAPDSAWTALLRAPKARRDLAALKIALRQVLPNRLAERWLELNSPRTFSNQSLLELERLSHRWKLVPSGTEGYEKAEVTVGGVDTNELSARTMESKKVPGLFFIGEVVDVTGHLGGFNFQWAWASGYCAGQAV